MPIRERKKNAINRKLEGHPSFWCVLMVLIYLAEMFIPQRQTQKL